MTTNNDLQSTMQKTKDGATRDPLTRRRTDNTMAKRRRTDNTMAKRKGTKGQETIEDTKRVIRSRKSRDGQYNGQK